MSQLNQQTPRKALAASHLCPGLLRQADVLPYVGHLLLLQQVGEDEAEGGGQRAPALGSGQHQHLRDGRRRRHASLTTPIAIRLTDHAHRATPH